MDFFKRYLHWFSAAFISAIILLIQFNNHYWTSGRVMRWDVYGYSQYLSAGVIYKDIKHPDELYAIDSIYKPTEGSHYYGRHCVDSVCSGIAFKYTMGNAVMMSPFYLVAHIITQITQTYPPDGYSLPYQFAVSIAAWFWASLSMLVLALLLRRWFSPAVTSITLFLIAMGTNYLYYATLEPGMSHIPSFFCVVVSLFALFAWLEKGTWAYVILFGFATGLVALIRLPDLVMGIIPAILFSVKFFNTEKEGRVKLFIQGVVAALIIAGVFSLQMVYWKYVAGTWFHYSYVDENFYFNNPHILDGLFSYRKGWLLYTPIMLFALTGIIILIKRQRCLGIGVLIFVLINVYVVFSWQTWWYGGSFGARCMIQSYAILVIPLAYFIQLVVNGLAYNNKTSVRLISSITTGIVFLFFALSLFQTFQYKKGIIHYDSMDKKAYWAVFGKINLTAEEFNSIYR